MWFRGALDLDFGAVAVAVETGSQRCSFLCYFLVSLRYIDTFSRRCAIDGLQSKQAPWTSDGFSGFLAVWEKDVIDLVREGQSSFDDWNVKDLWRRSISMHDASTFMKCPSKSTKLCC